MTKQQNDCFMELALVASFIPLGDNFHSRFVCECVQYVQFILYPETFAFFSLLLMFYFFYFFWGGGGLVMVLSNLEGGE